MTQNLASVEQGGNLSFWIDVRRTGEELLDKGAGELPENDLHLGIHTHNLQPGIFRLSS